MRPIYKGDKIISIITSDAESRLELMSWKAKTWPVTVMNAVPHLRQRHIYFKCSSWYDDDILHMGSSEWQRGAEIHCGRYHSCLKLCNYKEDTKKKKQYILFDLCVCCFHKNYLKFILHVFKEENHEYFAGWRPFRTDIISRLHLPNTYNLMLCNQTSFKPP